MHCGIRLSWTTLATKNTNMPAICPIYGTKAGIQEFHSNYATAEINQARKNKMQWFNNPKLTELTMLYMQENVS